MKDHFIPFIPLGLITPELVEDSCEFLKALVSGGEEAQRSLCADVQVGSEQQTGPDRNDVILSFSEKRTDVFLALIAVESAERFFASWSCVESNGGIQILRPDNPHGNGCQHNLDLWIRSDSADDVRIEDSREQRMVCLAELWEQIQASLETLETYYLNPRRVLRDKRAAT